MAIQFFDTLTRKLEEFRPMDPKVVKMYTCGPTVYDFAHIGNFRAYVFEDLLQRHLEVRGYKVERVMNLTDVDDKTIKGSMRTGLPLNEFTRPFKEAFFEDLKKLNIKPADKFPAATDSENIARMIEMIGVLIERGYAYQAEDKSVYFRIAKFKDYGCLAHLNLEELRPTGRIQNDEYEKENVGDFAVWKAWDEKDGDVFWESPWGRGRPGWHVECSAMATGILGEELDIHCGGEDNIFPHHEAEIAQSEAVTGKRFVRTWLHCKHLMVEGRKMSKSEGNFFTLRDLFDKGWTGREIRYALLAVNYRLPLNFTFDGLEGARNALARLDEWTARLGKAAEGTPEPYAAGERFFEAMDDNLNASAALGVLFQVVRDTNTQLDAGTLTPAAAAGILAWWEKANSVLGLEAVRKEAPAEVLALAENRKAARAAKDWKQSDVLRDQIDALGWQVKDTKNGQELTFKGGA